MTFHFPRSDENRMRPSAMPPSAEMPVQRVAAPSRQFIALRRRRDEGNEANEANEADDADEADDDGPPSKKTKMEEEP